jgi:hypothetical protein
MGYGTRDGGLGGKITTFWPDDTDEVMHIEASVFSANTSLQELLEKAQEKWPGISFDQIQISAAHVHTDCIGYDRYDSMDYTDFIVLRKI